MVLRGGSEGPNYDSVHVKLCEEALEKAGMPVNIMVDCSHANSNKDPSLQPLVAENVASQIVAGNQSLIGLMLESHLHGGNQSLTADPAALAYGVSITDGCIGWEETEQCLRSLRDTLRDVLPQRGVQDQRGV